MKAIPFSSTTVREVTMPNGIGRVLFNDYFGQGHQVLPGPQAYLVTQQDAGSEIYPHFHDVDQFQIFLAGNGRIGTHSLQPISAHYVDGYSPYGPIVAGPNGLSYLVLRLAAARGGWKMPENRHMIIGGPGRRVTLNFDEFNAIPLDSELVQCSSLWAPSDDGLGMSSIHMGPNSTYSNDITSNSQYILVTAGTARLHNVLLPPKSLIFLEPGEPELTLNSTNEGAVLLVLTFPLPSERPGSDPERLGEHAAPYIMPATED